MTDRVSRETVEQILEGYSGPQIDAVLNSFNAKRRYVAEGRRIEPQEIPDYGGPDSEFYEGVSRQELEEFDDALSTIKAGSREQDDKGNPLILNEPAMYDEIVSGKIEFYAPWNVGMDQEDEDIQRIVDALQQFAEVLESQTILDAGVTVYTLEPYAVNNGNQFQDTRKTVKESVKPMENISLLEWSDFEKQVLGEELGPELGYRGMRKRENDLMSGRVRLSPAENPDQEDKPYVDQGDNPKDNEAVIYGPFFGPWKSGYDERKTEVPELLDEMRSAT